MAVSAACVDKLANMKREDATKGKLMRRVENLIVFESDFKTNEAYKASLENAVSAGFTVHCFDAVIEAGRNASPADKVVMKPKGEDVYMLGYTSGTTGNPKGVKVRHNSPLGTAIATNVRFGD
jgi:long-subunit acyl-CoA synthetase (AMP-forming)